MSSQPTEAVIAGSKGFALALLAPLTARVGLRPRVAADPVQALAVAGGAGLVVVEFQGDRSLEDIRKLLQQRAGLAVVAAVPDGHPGAEEALRSLGVEPARWDGSPDGVLTAVSRRLGAAPAPAPPVAAAPPRPPPAAARAPAEVAAGSRMGALFDDLSLDEASADPFAPDAPVAAVAAAPRAPAPPPAASGVWPKDVPGAAEAAAALERGMRGVFAPEGSPLAAVAGCMVGMSALERAVLLGEPQPLDAAPIRRAAIMRVRVAAALGTAPTAAGAPVDAAAVSALLAEIDGLLTEVNALVAAAPAELQGALAEVRNALVKEAIDFSEAAHRGEGEAAGAAQPAPGRPGLHGKAAHTRILAVTTPAERELEAAQTRRGRLMLAALGLAALVAGGFHGYRYYERATRPSARPTRTGAPESAVVVAGPGDPVVVVRSNDGEAFAPDELKRMIDVETAKGNVVTEAAPGVVHISSAKAASPPAPGAAR